MRSGTNPMTYLRLFVASAILTLLALAAASTPVRAEACVAQISDLGQMTAEGDLDKASAIYTLMGAPDAGCTERVLHCAGDTLARAYLAASYDAADRGATPSDIEKMLVSARTYGSPWQVLVGLADVKLSQGQLVKSGDDYQAAAQLYQDALNVINEEPVCADLGEPPLPGVDEIAAVHKRMEEALLLAPQLEVVRTRAGDCGGIFLQNIRGFTPKGRPIPITFDFNKASLNKTGEVAAKILLDCVKQSGYSEITLSGHTDPVGSESYNFELSAKRLATIADYMLQGGFQGLINVVPKGETDPFIPDDPTAYTEEERHQFDRRVVLDGSTK
jgi:OmpA-OmpF porin, OOP family